MKKQLVFLSAVVLAGAVPLWASARPHHARHVVAHLAAPSRAPLRLQPISYDPSDHREAADFPFAADQIARDRIPTRASNPFGRGGVASIGYEPGSTRPPVGAHEINAAFSSQPMAFGGVVGGGVSLNF